MQRINSGTVLYSASDLVNFLECEHLTTLDLINLETPLPKSEADDEAKLIQAKGNTHEALYLNRLRAAGLSVTDVAQAGGTIDQKLQTTHEAMQAGVDIIYQATLKDGCFIGYADFLRRVGRPSDLGRYSYEVIDTKLARSAKAKFIIQLAFYSSLLSKRQGCAPEMMHVVLGDQSESSFRYADYSRYFGELTRRFLQRVAGSDSETYPDPCERCDLCKWRELCEGRRIREDHLSLVANISREQIKKLNSAEVSTLQALATLADGTDLPKISPDTLCKLHQQAALQLKARESKKNHLELLVTEQARGFARLPRPNPGDLFFDMEGDPFEEGGLEYLFGLYFHEEGKAQFRPFWGHSRAEEKRAFEQFMDFATARLRTYPDAYIYHYAHYEATALKKLMSLHGTREAEVDNLLRAGKLIDLYKVVREGLRVSEPRYSIKNIEHFYLDNRVGEVKSAGASIVYYERWKETGDAQLLKDIESYNCDDVRSTYELRQWLLTLRPPELAWANENANDEEHEGLPEIGEMTDAEKRLVPYRERLVDLLPVDRTSWSQQERLQELTYQLLDFHRRAAKPEWWAMFARMEKDEEQLLGDVECLAGLSLDSENPPRPVRRSILYTYRFPEQETKLRTGIACVNAQTLERLGEIQHDEETRRVSFQCSQERDAPPTRLNIGPGGPISTAPLKEALFRFADSVIANDGRYPAIRSILNRELPRIEGHSSLAPIIDDEQQEAMPQIVGAVSGLKSSHVFVQGPPGAGKTYTGSHVIVDLLKQGYKVGVSSNSHKAINNLLASIEKVSEETAFRFAGAKKSNGAKADTLFDGNMIEDVFANKEVFGGGYQLVAGTAWLFAVPEMDEAFDYLFVDEAGQVALANLIAMGTSARNIVLLGDQMQLGQPIQGVHPGRSGESILEYLLDGKATIPPEQGVFLATTWRMHPDVCRFISDAVYDGRLRVEPGNENQALLLNAKPHPALRPTGIRYLPVMHDGCSQRSEEEARLVCELVENLLTQRHRDKHGVARPITLNDILVVAPYNMQVNLLKAALPEGARVGTVDKFQGQEAPVVIVSMATSSGDYLPRDIEFLYSKNRLNVAISRAKCLVLFIANPELMSIRCSTPEEMALVNTLCWISGMA